MFRTSVPVTAEGFYNRECELKRLEQLVNKLAAGEPTWLVILGQRKIGKTSLVLELARRTARPALVFVVLGSFEEAPLTHRVYRRYALRTLDALFSRELGASLEAAAREPARYRAAFQSLDRFAALPVDLRIRVLELADREVDQGFLEDVLTLPEQLADALGLRIVVAWDEFQALANLGGARHAFDPFPMMRSVWQRQRRVAYVVSGSQRSMLEELVSSDRSAFFQHFSVMDLGPFTQDDALRLLVESAPPDRPIPHDVAGRITEILGGHPFYLQLFGEELTALAPPYDETSVKQALQDLLFSRTGRLALYLENVYRPLVGRSSYLALTLEALADGPCRLAEISRAIDAPSGATARYLERLGDSVERTAEGSYQLTDPILGLWVRWRRPGGAVIPMTVIGDEAEQRVARHLASLGFDLVYQSRVSRGAFDLLATRGAAQLGVQVKRSNLPLRFKTAEWHRMVAEAERLGWRWAVAAVPPPPGGDIFILDPARARIGREVRLRSDATIENVLLWLESA